jgi:signal peptidase II
VKKALIIFFIVIFIDQTVKFYIKTHFYFQEQVSMFGESEWAYLHFTENNGMAFGMELEGSYGKLILSIFRILAVAGIGWYLWDLIKKKAHGGLVTAIAFIFAGAIGNIIDSAFYGLIFSDSKYSFEAAIFLPPEGGYAGFLHGKVVDMFYFPMVDWQMPEWVPFWGGENCTFFSPVFNVADTAITIGVVMIILFQKKYFPKKAIETTAAGSETENKLADIIPPTITPEAPVSEEPKN